MAGGMDLGGRGRGKKPLDAVINLVPFIDLMAVTIAFLLITAVWTQTGAQPVSAPGQGEGERGETLSIALTERSVMIEHFAPIPLGELSRLEAQLKELNQKTATLQVEDGVRYEDLVHVIDACRGANVDVAVSPASG
jgi:biopolymer transport protein ExbD